MIQARLFRTSIILGLVASASSSLLVVSQIAKAVETVTCSTANLSNKSTEKQVNEIYAACETESKALVKEADAVAKLWNAGANKPHDPKLKKRLEKNIVDLDLNSKRLTLLEYFKGIFGAEKLNHSIHITDAKYTQQEQPMNPDGSTNLVKTLPALETQMPDSPFKNTTVHKAN